jgi:hypothetical protein
MAAWINSQVVVIEATTQAVWDLPAYYASLDRMTISPTTRRFVPNSYGQLALWTLLLARRSCRPCSTSGRMR